MSNTVDTRVVEMQFNNQNFEKNVATSLNTLDKLKNALSFTNSARNITDLQVATNNVDFTPFISALDTVKDRFSALGIVGATVINDLTLALMSKTKKLLTAIPNQISQGGLTRAMNIEQAKFMLDGLHVEWDKIYSDINYGVDKTAYGLDAAAKAASQLVASGVEFGETYGPTGSSPMAKALRGISGVAAMTNSSYEEITSIFTTVAGQGKLMTMQLRQLEARGLNVAAQMGNVMGKTEEQIREMVSKGEIDFEIFSSAMYDAFGEQAAKANDTYSGSLSNVKAALSRIGAEFKASRLENLRQIFVASIPVINNIKKQLSGFTSIINGMSTAVKDRLVKAFQFFDPEHGTLGPKMIQTVINGFSNLASSASQLGKSFSSAFSKVFFTEKDGLRLNVLTDSFQKVIDKIKFSTGFLTNFHIIFYEIFKTIKQVYFVFTTLGNEVLKILKTIFKIASPGLSLVYNLTIKLLLIIQKLTGPLSSYIELVGDGLNNAIISLSKKSFPIFNKLTGIFKIIEKAALGSYTSVSKFINELSESFKNLAGPLEIVKNVFNSILGVLKPIISYIGEALSGLWENLVAPFKNNNVNYLLSFISAFEVALTSLLSTQLISTLAQAERTFTGFKGIISTIKAPFWDLQVALKSYQQTLKAGALQKIAKAVIMLAGAMFILSIIDKDKLRGVTEAMTILMADLISVFGLFITFSNKAVGGIKNVGKLFALNGTLISLGAAMLILSFAAKNLSSLNWEELKIGLSGLGIILAELAGFLAVSKLDGPKGSKTAMGLVGIATAVYILAGALQKLSSIDPDTIGVGLGAMAAIFGVLGIFTNIVNPKKIISTGIAMNLIAASLLIFAKGLTALGEIPIDTLKTGLIAMGIALGEVALAMRLMPKGSIFDGAAMVIAAAALIVLAKALKEFSDIPMDNLKTGLIGMGIALAEIAIAMLLMKKALPGAAALLVVSAAMKILAGVVKTFAAIPVDKMVAALVAFGAALTIIVLAGMGAQAAAVGLLALGAAVTLIGAGFLMAGTGILAFSAGLALLATSGAAGLGVLAMALINIINLIPIFMAQLGYGLIALLDVLSNSYDSLVRFGVTLIVATCDGFIQSLPKIMELIGVLFDTLEALFFDYGPRLIDMGINMILMLADGIINGMPAIVDKAFVIIITFIDSMSAALDEHGDEFWQAVDNFILSVLDFLGLKVKDWAQAAKDWLAGLKQGFEEKAEEIKENIKAFVREKIIEPLKGFWEDLKGVGAYLIDGLIQGILNTPILGTIAKLGGRIIGAFNGSLQINSPSKLTEMTGEYFIEGFNRRKEVYFI